MSDPIDTKAVLADCLPPNPANYKSDFQCMTVVIKRLDAVRAALAQEITDHEADRKRLGEAVGLLHRSGTIDSWNDAVDEFFAALAAEKRPYD